MASAQRGDGSPNLAGEWLRAIRGWRRMSQRELAERAGVPQSTVERIEAGTSRPRLDTLPDS